MNEATKDANPGESDNLDILARRQAWRLSPERAQWRRNTFIAVPATLATSIGLGALVGAETYNDYGGNLGSTRPEQSFILALLGGLLGLVMLFYGAQLTLFLRRRVFGDRVTLELARGILFEAEGEIAKSHVDISFTSLWFATQKRLDYYHEIATSQSQRSFAYGQAAAGAGLLVVLVCTVLAIVSGSTAGAVSAGILGGSAAALSGYVGTTFLRTHDVSAQQLRAYFSQPLEASRFLSAERLLEEIHDPLRREEAARSLMLAIVSRSGDASLE